LTGLTFSSPSERDVDIPTLSGFLPGIGQENARIDSDIRRRCRNYSAGFIEEYLISRKRVYRTVLLSFHLIKKKRINKTMR